MYSAGSYPVWVPSAAQCSAGCWVLDAGAGAAMPASESRPSSQSEWQSPGAWQATIQCFFPKAELTPVTRTKTL